MLPLIAMLTVAQANQVVYLWPNGAPGSESRRNEPETKPNPWSIGHIYNPCLTVYIPSKSLANGAAVVICPGGGHRELVVDEEGRKPAEFLNKLGVTAFVLKYRLFRDRGSNLDFDDTKTDTYRAMRLIRYRASEWGIDPKRIGMLGFSAGGENLSAAAFGPGRGEPGATDPIDRENERPDFAMWIYPGPLGIPSEAPGDAPPGFALVASDDDHKNAVMDLAAKYQKAKVPMEVHILRSGGHGFNMGDRSKLASVKTWPQRLADWLSDSGYLKKIPDLKF